MHALVCSVSNYQLIESTLPENTQNLVINRGDTLYFKYVFIIGNVYRFFLLNSPFIYFFSLLDESRLSYDIFEVFYTVRLVSLCNNLLFFFYKNIFYFLHTYRN